MIRSERKNNTKVFGVCLSDVALNLSYFSIYKGKVYKATSMSYKSHIRTFEEGNWRKIKPYTLEYLYRKNR